MLTMENIIYQIGSKSHFILFVTSILILHFKTKFLTIFLIGSFVNALINYLLKENHGNKFAIIENEYGEVGIDDGLVLQTNEEIILKNDIYKKSLEIK